ncbi:hypothetical protein FBQ96_11745 [Nitrospirales bacterium NOB]|nr:MAG: hypothetical protein UZ03_NOB001000122 [Nitrospira sp. OLB3]MBV6469848.1 hypothetical protein [Nitrospirota bacterium]MCK6492389.1 hypothetical protein [Nitrospira sp.]MDL1890234.1 hypothetical protein [Nitrospirales bacterium NOB]QOJ34133.1 MAG: hypothetical protein HRU82_03830 [Nitrospira sp.]
MSTVSSDCHAVTEGHCADCGHYVLRRTPVVDERAKVVREVCIRCLVFDYQRRQFESGCCG